MSNIVSIMIILFFLCLEGIFSGGEIALVAADANKIRNKAKRGSRSASITMKLLDRPEWFLSTTLTGTNLCVVTNTAIATSMFITMFGTAQGELLAVVIMVPLLLIMGEMVPKTIFQQHADAIALRVSWFIWAVSFILYPIVFVISKLSRSALYMFSREERISYAPYITKAGLEFILQKRGAASDIKKSEKEMIERIFDFPESRADEIMVPLSNMTAISGETSLKEAASLIMAKGYTRIPVYQDHIYNIVGTLHSFDLLEVLYGQVPARTSLSETDPVEKCVRRNILFIPYTKPTDEILVELQRRGEHMAIVVNEYGGAVGIVTIEDILEEIVGEIDDEYDDHGAMLYRKVGSGRYVFNAQVKIDRLREIVPCDIPEGDYETLGGFLLYVAGKIPKKNESVRYGKMLFIVEDADLKSIKEVLMVLPEATDITK